MRKPPPLGSRTWKPEELQYLEDNWGVKSVPAIAKALNRTVNGVTIKAQRLGLGSVLMAGDYITLHQLQLAVLGSKSGGGSYILKSWVENRGLPVHRKKVKNNSFRVVYLQEFWEWAERNRSFIDFSKMDECILGAELEWVKEQRRKDRVSCAIQRKDPWTPEEDGQLLNLLKQQKYGYAEISKILRRSAGAIQRRCNDLGTKYRPCKADNHGEDAKWTQEHFGVLAEGIKNGDSYTYIGNLIGKSEKAVRGKVYFVYLTENADKVRMMIGTGNWGDGAPEPTVRQGAHLSRTRTEVKKNLSRLVTALKIRRNELGYDPYWQRFMCVNWDDIEGCTARCENCDECTAFRRIRPQYCVRCGATFYERKENTICEDCRKARVKQAQKKWSALNKKHRR